jgi:hypothetical protein
VPTEDEIVAAYQEIGRARERYRQLLRAGIDHDRVNQTAIGKRIGKTREKVRQDAMTDEELEALRGIERDRKRAKRVKPEQP